MYCERLNESGQNSEARWDKVTFLTQMSVSIIPKRNPHSSSKPSLRTMTRLSSVAPSGVLLSPYPGLQNLICCLSSDLKSWTLVLPPLEGSCFFEFTVWVIQLRWQSNQEESPPLQSWNLDCFSSPFVFLFKLKTPETSPEQSCFPLSRQTLFCSTAHVRIQRDTIQSRKLPGDETQNKYDGIRGWVLFTRGWRQDSSFAQSVWIFPSHLMCLLHV